ncbi:hypothetical protein D1614_24580, partial [Maribellus luteus]
MAGRSDQRDRNQRRRARDGRRGAQRRGRSSLRRPPQEGPGPENRQQAADRHRLRGGGADAEGGEVAEPGGPGEDEDGGDPGEAIEQLVQSTVASLQAPALDRPSRK